MKFHNDSINLFNLLCARYCTGHMDRVPCPNHTWEEDTKKSLFLCIPSLSIKQSGRTATEVKEGRILLAERVE